MYLPNSTRTSIRTSPTDPSVLQEPHSGLDMGHKGPGTAAEGASRRPSNPEEAHGFRQWQLETNLRRVEHTPRTEAEAKVTHGEKASEIPRAYG